MTFSKIKSITKLFLLLITFTGCGDIYEEELVKVNPIKPGISQININGKVFIPLVSNYSDEVLNNIDDTNIEVLNKIDATNIYEYNLTENKLIKTNTTFPKNFIGHALCNEQLYIVTTQSVALYKLNNSKLERLYYLPTPNGDNIVACFAKNEALATITITFNTLKYWVWENNKWKLEKTLLCNQENTPNSAITSVATSTVNYLFWVKNKIVFCLNLENEKLTIQDTHINNLSHICAWVDKNEIYISGFDDTDNLLHFNFKTVNSSEIAINKVDLGDYPTFNSKIKFYSLLPIQIDENLKGFVYGLIDDTPIWITSEKKEFPQFLVRNSEKKIKNIFYLQLGKLMGVIFLFSYLAWKISTAWEQRFVTNNIPQNSIFFGPTLHRGMAFVIDALTIFLITHFLVFYLPENLTIFKEAIKFLQLLGKRSTFEAESLIIEKQVPFIITGYMVNLVYCTITEYFFCQTLGKFSLGLKVYSDKNLRRLNIFQAISRNIAPKYPPFMPIILFSNISISVTDKKKSLNDYLGNTVVLYSRLHDKLKLNISNQKR